METIGEDSLLTYLAEGWGNEPVRNLQIRRDPGFRVTSFRNLVTCVAQLAFYNPNHVLLFRGQNKDYHKPSEGHGLTVLKPTIFRVVRGEPLALAVPQRYRRLERAEKLLAEKWVEAGLDGPERILRHRILRWAILQHYEVCRTPLLDATHSLRVAASIASIGAVNQWAYLYVLAVPQLSGAITASAEAGLQIVRLSSICPPSARRPHFQEGYLVGEYPEIQTPDEKRNYEPYEIDVCRRLLAKFRLELNDFWSDRNFPMLLREALFPEEEEDGLELVIKSIRADLGPEEFRLSPTD